MTASTKDAATIAVLNTKLDGAITQIGELKTRFDVFQSNFIRSDIYTVKHDELVKQVTINSNEIAHLQKSRWIMPTGTFLLGGVMLFLINYAITH